MMATLQNTGQQVSMAIFFTIVIVSLSTGLTGSVGHALTPAQVGPPDQGILTGDRGVEPDGSAVRRLPGGEPHGGAPGRRGDSSRMAGAPRLHVRDPPGAALLRPGDRQAAFGSALSEAFLFAGTVTALSALISAFRGERFVYGEPRVKPSGPTPPSTASPEPGGATATVAGVRSRP